MRRLLSSLPLIALVSCGSSHNVKIDAEVMVDRDLVRGAPIVVKFFERDGTTFNEVNETILSVEDALAPPMVDGGSTGTGPIPLKVDLTVEGRSLWVLAVVDWDENGKCTQGEGEAEPWGHFVTLITDETKRFRLQIRERVASPAVCPIAAEFEVVDGGLEKRLPDPGAGGAGGSGGSPGADAAASDSGTAVPDASVDGGVGVSDAAAD